MMCQRIGRLPMGTIGLGRTSVSSFRRVPMPPQSTKTGVCALFDTPMLRLSDKNNPHSNLDDALTCPVGRRSVVQG